MVDEVRKTELLGIPFIVLVGSTFHFAFAWSGDWTPVAMIAAVNESVWEHLKLAFWPSAAWAVYVQSRLKLAAWPFWAATGFSLLVAPVFIVIVFYSYTSLLGRNYLALDIATFVAAIAVGQLVSARLVTAWRMSRAAEWTGAGLLACQLIAFSTLTFFPPPLALFEDGRNGTRGIPGVEASRTHRQ